MKKKTIAVVLALVLVICCAVGGVLAWLTDTTAPIENIFTVGNVKIALAEGEKLDLKMVPGQVITKDPVATVKANSEACYLFVKVEKSDNFDEFMTYTMAEGWNQLKDADGNDVSGVYYRVVGTAATDTTFNVIKDDTVNVKGTVTQSMMDGLTDGTLPTLTFTAYACQSAGFDTPAAAWAAANFS